MEGVREVIGDNRSHGKSRAAGVSSILVQKE